MNKQLQTFTVILAAMLSAAALMFTVRGTSPVQAQSSNTPRFQVFSIRPCSGGWSWTRGDDEKNRAPNGETFFEFLSMPHHCAPLAGFMRRAYAPHLGFVPLDWIEKAPPWVRAESYQINAIAPSGISGETLEGPMLRALLEERFHLRGHWEDRPMRGYKLTVAAGGIRGFSASDGSCIHIDPYNLSEVVPHEKLCGGDFIPRDGRGPVLQIRFRGEGMVELADFLFHITGQPVAEQTGVSGSHDFSFEFLPDGTTPNIGSRNALSQATASGPTIFVGLQSIGLNLTPADVPVGHFVVDAVDRPDLR